MTLNMTLMRLKLKYQFKLLVILNLIPQLWLIILYLPTDFLITRQVNFLLHLSYQ